MSVTRAKQHLEKYGAAGRIRELDISTATVELAAAAIGCEGARIAKTLSFRAGDDRCLLIVAAGDAKVDNRRFKDRFGFKARMLEPSEAERLTGHAVGGVCPFGAKDTASVYLDESLRRFDSVYPACGSSNSMIELSIPELEEYSEFADWVDVCKGWREDEE